MKLLALIVIAAATSLSAQKTDPKPVAPKTPPAISAELKAQFFKAQLTLKSAQESYERAQKASMDSVNAINATCGSEFQATMDADGDPSCTVKAKVEEPAKK